MPTDRRRDYVPIDRIVRDPKLQMRAGGLDPAHVDTLREVIRDPDGELPPCEIVTDGATNWLTEGFHRVAAYEAEGLGHIPCVILKGNFRDAMLRAVGSNARHGLNRKPEDCQRAFDSLLADDELFRRIVASGKGEGGAQRALAKACGLSPSIIAKYLDWHGLRVNRSGEVVEATDLKPSPRSRERKEPDAPAPPDTDQSDDAEADATGHNVPDRISGDDEPLYTVPPPPPTPSTHPGLQGGARPAQFAAARATADQILRDLRSAATGIEQLCSGRGGAHLRRMRTAGGEIVTLRPVKTRGGHVRQEWGCSLLGYLVAAVRRSRPDRECSACLGEGCKACIDTGFVPSDESLIRPIPNNPALDLGDPWDWQEGDAA